MDSTSFPGWYVCARCGRLMPRTTCGSSIGWTLRPLRGSPSNGPPEPCLRPRPHGIEVGDRVDAILRPPMNRRLIKQRNRAIWELYNDPTQQLTVQAIGRRFGLSRRAIYHVVARFARSGRNEGVR